MSGTRHRRPTAAVLLGFLSSLSWLFPCLSRAEPLTLPELVRQALERNERPRIAELGVTSARAAVDRARAGFLPTVSLGVSETLRPASADSSVRSSAANGTATVTQPLLSAPAFPLYASAQRSLEAARISAAEQRRLTSFEAAHAFFSAVAQERVLAAARHRLERAEASLKDAQARMDAQLVSSNDVTRVQIEKASALQSVASAQSAVQQARIELAFVVGAPADGELQPPSEPLAPPTADAATLGEQALAQRPDLLAARASLSAAREFAREPDLRLWPTLDAELKGRAADSAISGGRHVDGTLSLNLNWKLWDAGLRSADADARRAAADVLALQDRALERRIRAEVASAAAELAAARASLDAAQQGMDAARKSQQETRVLYGQGLAKAIELVDATLSRYAAEVSHAGAQLAVRQAELDLRAALGLFPVDGLR